MTAPNTAHIHIHNDKLVICYKDVSEQYRKWEQ